MKEIEKAIFDEYMKLADQTDDPIERAWRINSVDLVLLSINRGLRELQAVNQTGAEVNYKSLYQPIFDWCMDVGTGPLESDMNELIAMIESHITAPNPQPVSAALEALDLIVKHLTDYVNDGDWHDGEVLAIENGIKTLRQALAQAGGEKTLDKTDD